MQAFRAAAKRLVVVSKCKGGDAHVLALDRNQVDNIAYPAVTTEAGVLAVKGIKAALSSGVLGDLAPFRDDMKNVGGGGGGGADGSTSVLIDGMEDADACGTTVLLDQFDPVWFRSVTADTVSTEIQRHFESLLSQPNLVVVVSEKGRGNRSVQCEAFDYSTIDGQQINVDLPVGDASMACRLVVSRKVVAGKRPRFFKKGRCIGAVGETPSFIAVSEAKVGLPHTCLPVQ